MTVAVTFLVVSFMFYFAIGMIATEGKPREQREREAAERLREEHRKMKPTEEEKLEEAKRLRRIYHPMICEILRRTPEELKRSYWTTDRVQGVYSDRDIYQLGMLFDFRPRDLWPKEMATATPVWKEHILIKYGMHPIDGDIYTERPIEPRDEINERCRSIVKKYGYWDYDKERPNIFRSDELYRFLKFPNDYEEEEAAELRRELVKRNEMESLATKEFEKSLEEARKS